MYLYDYFILLLINKESEWEYCRYGKVYLLQRIMFNTKVGTNGKDLNLFKINYNPFYEKGVVRVIELWEIQKYCDSFKLSFLYDRILHSNFVK